jgi:hypothetical protein
MSYLRDIAVICGLGLVIYGLSEWSIPLAFVVGGGLLSSGACIWSWLTRKELQ